MSKTMKNNGVDAGRYAEIKSRYEAFSEQLNDLNVTPIKVFDPLPPKALAELELIRAASLDLQAKKDDDVKKAAQAALEQAEAKEAVEQNAADTPEKEN